MKFRFLAPASAELDDAVVYYEAQQPGLGLQFAAAVERSLSHVALFAEGYQQVGKYSRRCLVSGFPYGIIYQSRPSHVLVVAGSGAPASPSGILDAARTTKRSAGLK